MQKCDAKHPCSTCTVAKTAAECVYDDQRISCLTGFKFLFDTQDYSVGQHLGDAESTVTDTSMDAIPPIFVPPSFLHQPIPPNLWVNLSFLGEENLQVRLSESDATDTDMKSCVLGEHFIVTNSLEY